jgi:hypothetical protein
MREIKMIKIRREYPKMYHVECEECGADTFLHKVYYKKFGWNKHICPKAKTEEVPVVTENKPKRKKNDKPA